MSKFIGKTAVISGGAEGIGLSIAKALGEQKMNIVLTDINEKNLKKASLELETIGVPVLPVVLDVLTFHPRHSPTFSKSPKLS